jgi:hypothetical protein
MNEATSTQLRLVTEIRDALAEAGIAWWLFGGWAMDFHAGRVTRDHSDIEFYAYLEHAPRIRDLLTARGFGAPPGLHPDEGQPFLKDGQELGLWYLTDREDGAIVTPGRWSDWPWPAGSFDGPAGTIGDIEAPVVTLDCLLETKMKFAEHPHGAPLRDKDIADIALLRSLRSRRSHAH